jgi:hypothetical protein
MPNTLNNLGKLWDPPVEKSPRPCLRWRFAQKARFSV